MRSQKIFFAAMMVVISGVGAWMGGVFLLKLHEYLRLSHSSPATIHGWKIEEVRPGKFAIHANFEFQAGEVKVAQQFRFPKPIYQNRHLAQDLIGAWGKTPWRAWYNPRHPEKASLQRKVPVKSGVYCAICFIIIIYLSLLKVYVRRFSGVDSH